MTIAVIGHLCLDVIHHPDGSETNSHGGIFFSVAALANLLDAGDTVMPVFGVGKADYDALMGRLSQYPNVDTSGIYRFNGPTNQVHLYYSSSSERVECSKNIADPVPWKRIRPTLDADMVLLNMISGFDITLETLDEIRMEVREKHTPIYMDVHSLTLGVKEDHTRYLRPVDNWRRWLFMIHAAQLNAEEAAALTQDRLDEDTLAKHVHALNTHVLIITRGGGGYSAFTDVHKQTKRFDAAASPVPQAVDSTGCGDVFAAAYCAKYCSSRDPLASAEFANQVAGMKATLAGSEGIGTLSAFRREPAAAGRQE